MPISLVETLETPVWRRFSSTCWASSANWSSVTGLPWHAFFTPETTLFLEKGSTTPERLTTWNDEVSSVVKRFLQAPHSLRRRMEAPSSAMRVSTTRESAL